MKDIYKLGDNICQKYKAKLHMKTKINCIETLLNYTMKTILSNKPFLQICTPNHTQYIGFEIINQETSSSTILFLYDISF